MCVIEVKIFWASEVGCEARVGRSLEYIIIRAGAPLRRKQNTALAHIALATLVGSCPSTSAANHP